MKCLVLFIVKLFILSIFSGFAVFSQGTEGGKTSNAPQNQSVEVTENKDDADSTKTPEIGWRFRRGEKEINFETGFSPIQPTFFSGNKEYETSGRKFASTSFRFGRVIGTKKSVTYQYLFEVLPASIALKNEVKNPKYISPTQTPNQTPTIRQNTYGIGIKPVNFRFIFLPRNRFKPYAQVGAGFLFTRKPIPTPESMNVNFIGDFGGGVMFHVKRSEVVNVGYRYFHISNMNLGKVNPGYNANVFYVGYSFFWK